MNLYFDNAATSWPKAPGVARAVEIGIREGMGSPGRSAVSGLNRVMFQAREALARLIHAPDSSRIAFGLNATQMINIALQGLVGEGDRVITTSMEHNAVARPLRFLEQTRRIELTIIPCSPEGYLDPDDVKKALCKKTRLFVMNHSSNVTGALNELNPVGRIVREAGTVFMVDCAQSAGVTPIDVTGDRVDILAGPGHKSLLGPSGTGFLYVGDVSAPGPLIHGGTGSHSEQDTQPEEMPDRYESGTQNFHGVAGLLTALEFIEEQGIDSIAGKERRLAKRMLDGLADIRRLRLYGPKEVDRRTLIFSVAIPGKDPADLANHLHLNYGIVTRTGLHCAPWAHRTAGSYPQGTVRLSPGLFHEETDIDHVIHSLAVSVEECRS